MGETPVHYEIRGRMDLIDPDHQHVQVGSYSAEHQGGKIISPDPQEAAQEIGKQCMGEEVHQGSLAHHGYFCFLETAFVQNKIKKYR